MVYSNKFVVCVLVNGTPVKELSDSSVLIPHGTTYSLRLRNRNSRRAVVKFWIDGEEASGNGYIIDANKAVDIHRYAAKDVAFKFVNLDSSEAVDFGKNGPNHDKKMGVIEARFYLEKAVPEVKEVHHHHHYPPKKYYPIQPKPWITPAPWMPTPYYRSPGAPIYGDGPTVTCHNSARGLSTGMSMSAAPQADSTVIGSSYDGLAALNNVQLESAPTHDVLYPQISEGCTVEGEATGQRFTTSWIDVEEDFVALKIVLKATNQPLDIPVALAGDPAYCGGCGAKKGRKSDKFCGQCGHKL